MLHQHMIDWEVVDSHTVVPVRRAFDQQGVKIVQIAPNEVEGSYTFDMKIPRADRTTSRSSTGSSGGSSPVRSASPSESSSSVPTQVQASQPAAANKLKKTQPSSSSHGISCPVLSNPFDWSPSRKAQPLTTSPKGKEASLPATPNDSRPATASSPKMSLGFLRPSRRESSSSDTSASGTSDGERSEASRRRSAIFSPSSSPKSDADKMLHRHSASASLPSPPSSPAPSQQSSYDKHEVKKVLKFARAELMKQLEQQGYNVLVVEGWELTILRQDTRFRIKVNYQGRGAIATLSDSSSSLPSRLPPFINVLDQ